MIEAIGGTRFPQRDIVSQALLARKGSKLTRNMMEQQTREECEKYLKCKGYALIGTGVRFNTKRDFFYVIFACLRGGRSLTVFVKRPYGSYRTTDQIRYIEDVQSNNGLVFTVKTVAELSDALAKEGY